MDLLKRFREYIKAEQLPLAGNHLLIAVSGGLDSVVLCRLCKEMEFSFSIAHCNFKLRGKESDEDETFVRELAAALNVEFLSKSFETEFFAGKEKLGIQEAARQLRYGWFEELLNITAADGKMKFDFLLTAHHADDNVETLLMNFFKGTGINGLSAMQPSGKKILRPLLFAMREEIAEYANIQRLNWREDSSNLSIKYTRNYFRLEIIPAIEKVFPEVRSNLLDNIRRFADIKELYAHATRKIIDGLMVQKGEEWNIPARKLIQQPGLQTVVFECTRHFGFTPAQSEEIVRLISAGTGKYIDSSTHRILKNRNWLIITPLKKETVNHFIIDEPDSDVLYPGGCLQIKKMPAPEKLSADPREAMLNSSAVEFPLLLRKWKQGDYFYPLGMRKKKKLSRFFIDQKIPLHEKENIWVLESAGRIIWVIGHRIDDRFKWVPSASEIIHLALQ